MTRTIHLRLAAVVDAEDESKCSAECPYHDYVYIIGGHPSVCDDENPAYSVCEWNDPHAQRPEGKQPLNVRHAACLAAEIKEQS
jgi:hypothetical protein